MIDNKSISDTKKQLTELLDRLDDGIDRQIIQKEEHIVGFFRIMSDADRELLTLQGVQVNATLLEILGYGYSDVEDHPVKKSVIGQISYSPDYILKQGQKHLAIIDLKAPDVELDHNKWLGQISSYCIHLEAPLGILFNGRSIRIYINTHIKRLAAFKELFADQPVAEFSSHNQEKFVDVLLKFSASSLKQDALAVAKKLALKKKSELESEKRRKQIQERIKQLLLNPPLELLASMSALEGIWDGIEPKPSEQEAFAAWGSKKEMPLTVNVIEATAKRSINSIVRQKVSEICGDKGWDYLESAKVKGLRYRYEGGNGYHPLAQGPGVPDGLCIGGLSTEDAKRVIQQLDELA